MVFLSIIPPIYANIPFIYPRYCGICHWNDFIRGLQNNNYPTYKPHIWLKCPLLQKDANHFLLQKKGVPVKVVWPNPHPSYHSLCGLVMIKWWFCLLYRQYMPIYAKTSWKVNSWNPMEIPRLYLLVLGKCYDLGQESEPKWNHLVVNHDSSLQPVFTTKWLRKVIL